jgi:ATP-binding cassette subfamily B protein
MKRPETLAGNLPGLRRILVRFWPYLGRHRALLAGSLLALLVQVALKALEPWPLKFVFDHLLSARGAHRLARLPALEGLDPAALVTLAALALVAITGLRALADYLSTVGFALAGNRMLTDVRDDLYRHVQGLSLSFHTRARGGELIVRLIADINALKNALVNAAVPLAASLLVVFSMVGVMLWLHWQLALLVLAMLPLFGFWATRCTRRVQQAARTQRQREGAMAATAAESIEAIKLVQALSLEGRFAASFSGLNRESQRQDVRGLRLAAALTRAVGFLTAVATAAVLWYGTRLVLQGELTPGELLVFLAYLKTAFRPVQQIAQYTGRLAKATAAGERVLDLFAQTPEVRDLPGAVPAPPLRGAVCFESVTFAYEPGRPVLDNLNLEVDPGRHVALVGPSGMGKSTLVSLILRLYDPQHGRVLIDGRDVREYTLASLRSQVSVVLQDTLLFAASVRENIACAAPAASAEAVEAAARLANAHDFIQGLPQGYDTILGERGVTLSGGQRQRLAIARAAVRKSPVVILDEPTTGLDEENERAVFGALRRIIQGRTCFFITHDLQLAATADLIVFLERGRVLEQGTHADLMQKGGRYAGLHRQAAGPADALRRPAGFDGCPAPEGLVARPAAEVNSLCPRNA